MESSRKLLVFLKPYWKAAILAPLLMILEVFMDLLQPRLVQRIIDQGIGALDMSVVISTGLWMLGIALIGAVGGVGCTIFSELASQGFGADVRERLFRKVESLSFANLDQLETGALITRLTNDVSQVQELVSMALRVMIRAPFMFIGSLIMAIVTSPSLALLLVVLMPVVLGVVILVIRVAYPLYGQVQRRVDELNTVMQENLAGVRVVKAFVRGAHEIARFIGINDRLMKQTIHAARVVAVNGPAVMMAMNLGVVGAVWFGGRQTVVGGMHVGQLIAFVNYLTRTLMSLQMVSMILMRVARAEASADRIQEVLVSEPTIVDSPDAQTAPAAHGRVAFERVSFGYGRLNAAANGGSGHAEVLRDVSFVAEPGQTVAILGATGSGKSSLIHLIPRFYDVTAGRITLDGLDIRDIQQRDLRRHIGVALQEPVLFTGTIRDNIRYGRPEAPDEEVIAAAKAAQAHEFIRSFTDGYDSVVGQRGVNLSGGQKQRIAIARALLIQPAVLILDDSTSSVDVETEAKIQEALEEFKQQRTCFVVAQRISTVLTADKILVLDDGRIAAEGTHKELMSSSPIYREIYDSQLGNGVIANVAD
jgi:ATP-binding cassette subfamily B protein